MTTIALHRPARSHNQLPAADPVGIPVPPTLPEGQGRVAATLTALSPLMLSLGSSLFIFSGGAGRGWLIYVLPAVMVAGVLMSIGVRAAQNRAARRKRKVYATRYLAYLEDQEVTLRQRAGGQRHAEEKLWPDPAGVESIATTGERLWERRIEDLDFLAVRLARGPIPLLSPAVMEGRPDPLADYEPELVDAARALVTRYSTLADAPIAVDLAGIGSLSICGDRRQGRALVRALLLQLGVLCPAGDLQVAVCFPTTARAEWEWAKWLPHARDVHHQMSAGPAPRCLLTDSVTGFASALSRVARPRTELRARLRAESGPSSVAQLPLGELGRLVLVIDGFLPGSEIAGLQALRDLFPVARDLGITLVSLVDSPAEEPGHVDVRIEISDSANMHLLEMRPDGRQLQGLAAEGVGVAEAETVARRLAPLHLEERRSQGRNPAGSVRLLELLGVEGASAVDPAVSWQPRSRQQLMHVPLGMGADGEPLILDLKEAAEGGMGPHGLVIGATGSGKSELLRTLVTGLAASHSPEVLSFVFVDFKGGAAFADLARIPHVAGLITNLQDDLSRVDRMYAALTGEQERRQRLLRRAGNLDGIKEYQVRRERDPDLEPMPYLMIVVDEFSELLVARPDFLDLFVAIGRVGRSLGMHLLLASQRLDEGRIRGLEGHLRYRICLRTFSPQESQAVLGTPDAYQLPSQPGAGYFKVDTTVYRRFKTALISAPAVEGAAAAAQRLPVAIFSSIAEASGDVSVPAGQTATGRGSPHPTEMELVISRLDGAGPDLSRPVHQVWLPPLESNLPLDSVLSMMALERESGAQPATSLRVPVGLVDLPVRQDQQPFILDFAGTGGHLAVVGAPQTGKSTFLRTLLAAFSVTHSPEDVQFSCIDLGGGTLHGLEALPHVSAVAGKLEPDKLRRVVRQMSTIIEEREILFRSHGIDSMASFRRLRARGTVPAELSADVFLLIDNWAQFRLEFEEADTEIVQICAAGLTYGVHVVITAGRWADIRSNLRDSIGGRLEFRLHDPTDSEMPRGAARTLPTNIPGRGLTPQGLHVQAALPRVDGVADSADLRPAVAAMVAAVGARWADAHPAPAVRLLPPLVGVDDLPDPVAGGPPGVPLGVEEFRLEPVHLDLFGSEPHALILGDAECGKTTLIRAWMHQLSRRHRPEEVRFILVDYRRTLLDAAGGAHVAAHAATPDLLRATVEQLRQTLIGRLPPAAVTREQLLRRSWWSGPDYVMFVDDYDLVVSPSGNPMQGLLEPLAQARDVGFHLVLARRVGGAARSAFEPVFQRVKELGSLGVVMSGDPQEGPLLGTQRAQTLPPGRGFLVRRGRRTALVQTVRVDAVEAAAG